MPTQLTGNLVSKGRGFGESMGLADRSDIEVVRALRAGDPAAMAILYDRYGHAVYRLALRLLGQTADAEDLTQEVFLRFLQRTTYDPQRGTVLVFLLTVTRSQAINRLRKTKSQQQFLQRWERHLPDLARDPLMENVSLTELQQRLTSELGTLPDYQRQVLEMAYYDGLTQAEIAQNLNVPLGTVKTRARQGLLKLRKLLHDLVD
jgi:RNA polymerase sigma-70 factor, ECF subfamily